MKCDKQNTCISGKLVMFNYTCHYCKEFNNKSNFESNYQRATNADKFRMMDDEELTDWLDVWGIWPFDPDGNTWFDWLKQYPKDNSRQTTTEKGSVK